MNPGRQRGSTHPPLHPMRKKRRYPMARSRSIPTGLLEDPDYIESSSDTQAILIGLVLMADDYGRGLAHTGILARKLNKAESLIEETLRELEACQMLVCYQGERYRYYSLCHWNEWQTLSKPTPSKYPAPPSQPVPSLPQDFPLLPKNPQENPGE